MITILSLMLITLSLLSGLIYIMIQMQSNIDQSFSIDYNKKQLNLITNNLASKILKDGNNYILPEGIVSDGYYQLPQWVSRQNDRSINGIPFMYCPVVNSSGVFNKTATTKKGSYNIRVEAKEQNANIPYIYHSSLNFDDALAFLISPIGNNSAMPSCEDISQSNGKYFAKGGQVSVIKESNIDKYSLSFNKDKVVSLSSSTALPTEEEINNGDFDTKSLELQINIFKNNNEKELTIFLESGTYNIIDINTFIGNNTIEKKLTIVGDENSLPIIQNAENSLYMNLENINITLQNILFKGTMETKNNNIDIMNSEIESLKANNSDILLNNVLISSSELNALHLINSNLKTSNRIETQGGFLFTGSDFKTNPEDLNEIATGNSITINTSNILISNASIDTNGYSIENKGNLNIKNSESVASFKINNYDNSVLNIENSFNTSNPVSVEDVSKMSYVSGSSSNISSCVGNIFEDNIKLELNELDEVVEKASTKENNAQNWNNC